jgi:hypothetical protein
MSKKRVYTLNILHLLITTYKQLPSYARVGQRMTQYGTETKNGYSLVSQIDLKKLNGTLKTIGE